MILKKHILLPLTILLFSCNSTNETADKLASSPDSELKMDQDSVLLRFSFVGCNRVEGHDVDNAAATNASTANVTALKRIFDDVCALKNKPALFFFLGDLVYAEKNTDSLNNQLGAWLKQYEDPKFSGMNSSGIEMVAVPGNHEMLYKNGVVMDGHDEWPLVGATQTWMKYMAPYMPKDRAYVGGADSIVNQMTFSFTRQNVAFIVMNTDTYNPPTKENKYGLEGMIPTQWVISKTKQYQQDPKIKHIFVLGHKPYYVSGKPETGHEGLPEGPLLWPQLNSNGVVAMLSAHCHDYQRMQPGGKGTYQIIAGNGGSNGKLVRFFGYSTIEIMSSGAVRLSSTGYKIGDPYYQGVPDKHFKLRDSTTLTWGANGNPYVAK